MAMSIDEVDLTRIQLGDHDGIRYPIYYLQDDGSRVLLVLEPLGNNVVRGNKLQIIHATILGLVMARETGRKP